MNRSTLPPACPDPSQDFLTQRYARAELLLAFTQLIAQNETHPSLRASRLLFLEGAREYLEADARLDQHRNKTARAFHERKHERSELLTCVWMLPDARDASDRVLDTLTRAFGNFLRKEMARGQ